MKFRVSFLLFALLLAGRAEADQCPESSAECLAELQEEQVYIAAYIAVLRETCTNLNPAQSAQYEKGVERMIEGEIEKFRSLQNSPLFATARSSAEAEIRKNVQQGKISEECADLLRIAARR